MVSMLAAIALPLLVGALVSALVLTLTAVVSRRVGRVSVVDVAWGLAFVAVAVALAALASLTGRECWQSWLLTALVAGWGLRLASHIHQRSHGAGEDPRYAEMLGDSPWSVVVRKVFVVQGLAVWVVSLPLAVAAAYDVRWSPLVWVGLAIGALGVVIEAVGDAQLAAYKRIPKADRPPVMDRGLWAWTRHPNYFGDACVWWGVWLAGALATGWLPGLLTIIAPAAMTWFLVFATGARLLERTMMQRPGYPEYAERTSMFVPLPPKRP